MVQTLKSLMGRGIGNSRITNQIFSDEIIFNKNLTSCVCVEIVFNKCTFNRLDFETTVFSRCKFQNCRFLESNLTVVKTYQCNFENCTFIKSNFSDSVIDETTFDCCQFKEICFAEAYFENCNFQDTEFKNIDNRSSCAILENSKISVRAWSISFSGNLNFTTILKFHTIRLT